MTDESSHRPPRPWKYPTVCPKDGCDVERFTPLGMGYHLLRDHEDGGNHAY